MSTDPGSSGRHVAGGALAVGDGNEIAWWTIGNPEGLPVLVLHGGPGSGTSPPYEELFDPDRFLVVHHDQRGSGRSRPPASDPETDMAVNTTHHLVRDIELLRSRLDIDRWMVFGASWGSTLALAYAQRHTDAVMGMVLSPVTVTTRSDIDWLYRGAGALFPEAWSDFSGHAEPSVDVFLLLESYAERLEHPDSSVRTEAAAAWCRWEDTIASGEAGQGPDVRFANPRFAVGFARTVTHYFRHVAWLEDDELIANARRLSGVPGALVHGRDDASAPIESVRRLAAAWPGVRLVEIGGGAHSFMHPEMHAAITDGAARIADQLDGTGR